MGACSPSFQVTVVGPGALATPSPDATATPAPTATPTPSPSPTPTATPTPVVSSTPQLAMPTISTVTEGETRTLPVGDVLVLTGTCDPASTDALVTTSAGAGLVTATCLSGVLQIELNFSSLPLVTPGARSVSVRTKDANDVNSDILTRHFFVKGTCPTNYLVVPGNATYGTSDFCIAKFEMKAVTSRPDLGPATLANGGNGNVAYNSSPTISGKQWRWTWRRRHPTGAAARWARGNFPEATPRRPSRILGPIRRRDFRTPAAQRSQWRRAMAPHFHTPH